MVFPKFTVVTCTFFEFEEPPGLFPEQFLVATSGNKSVQLYMPKAKTA